MAITAQDLEGIHLILQTAPRIGAETDIPEGSRCIQLSETLVNQMIKQLEYLALEKAQRD